VKLFRSNKFLAKGNLFKYIEDAHILTPLTSSTKPNVPTELHREIFEKVKLAMVNQPLFNNLIDIAAEKYLWVDTSTS